MFPIIFTLDRCKMAESACPFVSGKQKQMSYRLVLIINKFTNTQPSSTSLYGIHTNYDVRLCLKTEGNWGVYHDTLSVIGLLYRI